MDSTFALIKPTSVETQQTGFILQMICSTGYIIDQLKTIVLTKEEAETLYIEHKEREHFDDLVKYMCSGPVVIMKITSNPQVFNRDIEDYGVITTFRSLVGSTDPATAEHGTIRSIFGISVRKNTIHASDSSVSAIRELEIFF